MTELGADPADLRELANDLRHARRQLLDSQRTVTRMVLATTWDGRDATRFRREWSGHTRSFRLLGDDLLEAAAEASRNAEEQERVSNVGSTDLANNAVGAADPAAPTHPEVGRPPHGDPLPLRTESWTLGAQAAAAFGLATGSALTITDLPGNHTTVTIEDSVSGSVSVGLGAEAGSADAVSVEVEAQAGAAVTLTQRRRWQVDDADVGGFLMKLGLAEGIDRAPILGDNPLTAMATDRILTTAGLGVGKADTTDALFAIEGDLGADAAALVPLVGVSGAALASVGLRAGPGGRSLLLEGFADGRARAFGAGSTGTTSTSVEIPLRERGLTQPMILTTSTVVDGRETLERHVYDLDRDRTSAAVTDALGALSTGNPIRAIDPLESVLRSIPGKPVWSDSAHGSVNDDVHQVGVGVLLGPKLSGEIEGGRTITDYSGVRATTGVPPQVSGGGSW